MVVALALLAGCTPTGTPCGRGRCPSGACINAITTYTPFRGLEPDWWCVVPCKGTEHCAQDLCLQSPVDWEITRCSGDQLDVNYRYAAGTELNLGGPLTLSSFDITQAHAADGGTVHCLPGEVCNAGWYRSGELLPTLVATTSAGRTITLPMNGTPGEMLPLTLGTRSPNEPLGPLLPTGLSVVVEVGGFMDEHR